MAQEEDYARLIGILLTDGCVSPKGNSWRIIVSNNSQSIVDSFAEAVLSCFGKSVRRFKRGTLHVAVLDAKEVGRKLIEKHDTFRTEGCCAGQGCSFLLRGGPKPCWKCKPIDFFGTQFPPANVPGLKAKAQKTAFLQAVFSCDGGVNLYVARRGTTKWLIRNVYLACKHPKLIRQYARLLAKLGIKNRIIFKDWRLLIQGHQPIRQFARLVGFLSGSIIGANSPFWRGRTKAEVLDLLLESYGNPRLIFGLPMFAKNMG